MTATIDLEEIRRRVTQLVQSPADYIAQRPEIFPGIESYNWFVRKNREELIAAGALLRPTGRWLVRPEAFDQAVLKIGARRAVGAAA